MQLGPLRPLLLVGGVVGAMLRWSVGQGFENQVSSVPWGTLAVNVVGCGFLGYFLTDAPSDRRRALTIGFCGGLTTFSTLMVELIYKLESGHLFQGFGYLGSSIVLGLAALMIGRSFGSDRSLLLEAE